jgi:hypothetical protein
MGSWIHRMATTPDTNSLWSGEKPREPQQLVEGTGPATAVPAGRETARKLRGRIHPLVILLLVGALLRIVLWIWFDGQEIHIWDERDYNTLAVSLLERGEFASEPGILTSMRPPLYPVVVAGLYGLFGLENFQAVRLFQAGLSLLTVLVLYGLGSELELRRGALGLAALYCFYPTMLVYNNLLLTEVLCTFLLCAACYSLMVALKRQVRSGLLVAGVLFALAALTRSIVSLLPPFLAIFLFLSWRGPVRQRILAPVLLSAAFAATLAPWTIRNTLLQKTFITVDTMGGRNFMMGNYAYTPLHRSWDAISLEGEQAWFHELYAAYPRAEGMTQGRVDKLALRYGLHFVWENPGLTLKRDLVKLLDFWGLERELVGGGGLGYFGPISKMALLLLTALLFAYYAGAVILSIFGAIMAPPSDLRFHFLFLLLISFFCAVHAVVFAHSRYHLPIMPFVFIYTATAALHARPIWQRRHRLSFRLASGLSGLLVMGWLWSIAIVDLQRYLDLLQAMG